MKAKLVNAGRLVGAHLRRRLTSFNRDAQREAMKGREHCEWKGKVSSRGVQPRLASAKRRTVIEEFIGRLLHAFVFVQLSTVLDRPCASIFQYFVAHIVDDVCTNRKFSHMINSSPSRHRVRKSISRQIERVSTRSNRISITSREILRGLGLIQAIVAEIST